MKVAGQAPAGAVMRTRHVATGFATGVAVVLAWAGAATVAAATPSAQGEAMNPGTTVSLDGRWQLAPDPQNQGRDQRWYEAPQPGARETPVPWIIQEVFPGHHGVAWYWREFTAPAIPQAGGRYLLRFWQVDYLADVWVNGTHVGAHEGGEDPFVLDVTDAVRPTVANRLAVRVLNPTNEPIDGIALAHTPRRNKTYPYSPGSDYNYGGITDSVELLAVPPLYLEDLFALPDPATGGIHVRAELRNATTSPVHGRLLLTVAPAAAGETLAATAAAADLPPGSTRLEADLQVPNPHLWALNDPFLYRVTARAYADGAPAFDERSTRCGFRAFRFRDGYFRLNGRRLYVRSSHSGADTPVGIRVPYDRDLLRRDLLNSKVMGFNMIRFIAGIAQRDQLDLCDEIGLLVYEENFASWCLGESPKMAERFDHATAAMVRRDRNHPSLVMWGLLNETPGNSVFFRAVRALGLVRDLDDSRVVMLNSGGFDGYTKGAKAAGPPNWRAPDGLVPNATRNPRTTEFTFDGTTWPPGVFALHPGVGGEYSMVRWTAPAAGSYALSATFRNIVIHGKARTDVHLFHNGRSLFAGFINLNGRGDTDSFSGTVAAQAGDTVDCVVGIGDDRPYGDTTAVDLVIRAPDGTTTHDVTRDFGTDRNPNGVWTYGWLRPGSTPDLASFTPYTVGESDLRHAIGRLANPGSRQWEDVLADLHPYQALPHGAAVIHNLRTIGDGDLPVWLSEYGIGSALDLVRLARHYESLGKTGCEDAVAYRRYLDLFLADWERWQLHDTFASPEDYFDQCLRWHAPLRLLGTNAIRANPNVVGHSMTGTHDQGLTGEGITANTFRDLKPGVTDALFDAWYPLRWCLFVEPVHVYRGHTARFEAVLANEDALPPGQYPARLQVVRPDGTRLVDRDLQVTIPDPTGKPEPAFALPVFAEDIPVDGPAGRYRFLVAFQRGGAATGGDVAFHVADPADLPAVQTEVLLWEDDTDVAKWLTASGIRYHSRTPGQPPSRGPIVVGNRAPGEPEAWRDLARHIACGATAVFLSPEVFKRGDDPTAWLPLANKGSLAALPVWVYHKDDWAKRHPIFDGLPAGGILEHDTYREVIPALGWSGQDVPAEVVAGAINTGSGYSSGLTVGVWTVGAGRFVLNTLRIRENLGKNPVADRLLHNLLRYAARDAGKPPAELPPDFDRQLDALGYR